ncbi:MAG: NADH-quinone oxidoreductase subunit J [Thermomicrobiales bacterium]|jgi:NADH-quinone oxidoreductase subunit J
MPWELIFFYVIGAASVLCALGMVLAKNPVHSGIFLVLTFLNVAGIFVMLGAEFLAVIQIIVYTGAILILMLFVLMLVDPDDLPSFSSAAPLQRNLSVLLGIVLVLELAAAIITRTSLGAVGTDTAAAIDSVGGNTQAIGLRIYSKYLLAFEVTSLVLTVGVIGAVVLALPERLGEKVQRRRDTISLAHARGADGLLPEGPKGETPITVDPQREAALQSTGRTLIMTKDPDAYTRVGVRQGRPDETND